MRGCFQWNQDDPVITFDIDWAPDCAIEHVAGILAERRIRSTWFVTHASPAVERLRSRPELFELGIHPNFLPGSSHGATPERVLRRCLELVPEAVSMRSHALVQSTPLLRQIVSDTSIRTDVSLYLPEQRGLRPVAFHTKSGTLLRVPFLWEDDLLLEHREPCMDGFEALAGVEGLKVFNFHPIHIYLNSRTMQPYETVKRLRPRLTEVTDAEASPYVEQGMGTRALFLWLLDRIGAARRIRDIHAEWQRGHADGWPASRSGSSPDIWTATKRQAS